MVARVYGELVAQSRLPVFYTTLGVPDTIEGRFDLLVLHLFLLMHRCSGDDRVVQDAAQAVCDHFFVETDRALREMGVGDLTVPKKMKGLAGVYAGRSKAYTEALASDSDEALIAALTRNVYLGNDTAVAGAPVLALYVRRCVAHLSRQPALALVTARLTFPDVEGSAP